ncbi:MAG: hypothetical protein FJZ56_03735 [Chlamydiae bacterium]|nr:hypothetical protein [Chlamydiota bacterium]
MSGDKFKYYLHDLGMLLKEKAQAAKNEKDNPSNQKDNDYNIGYLMAFHEVIDLMKQQADVFDIKQDDIGLADIDAERDLL